MSTAVVLQYTNEGFAIAADSLRRDLDTGKELSRTVQKLFPIKCQGEGCPLAFAAAGSVEILHPKTGKKVINLVEELRKTTSKVRPESFPDFGAYGRAVVGVLIDRLRGEMESGKIAGFPSMPGKPGLTAQVLLAGYHKSIPSVARFDIRHAAQVLQNATLVKSPIYNFTGLSGSKFITDKIFYSDDPKFSKYRTPHVITGMPPQTLEEAVKLVTNYVQACIDHQEVEAECKAIGGQPQVAVISPGAGFRWIKKPRPAY